VGKRKVSIFSVLVLIVGISGLGLGVYSLYRIESPKPLARAFVSSGFSVLDSNWTVVNFDVVDYDVTSDFNILTNRFICPTSGNYLISGRVTFVIMLDGEAFWVGVFREDIMVVESSVYGHSTVSLSTNFADIVYLNGGDYNEVRVYHTGSFSRSIYGNTDGTYTYITIAATDILN